MMIGRALGVVVASGGSCGAAGDRKRDEQEDHAMFSLLAFDRMDGGHWKVIVEKGETEEDAAMTLGKTQCETCHKPVGPANSDGVPGFVLLDGQIGCLACLFAALRGHTISSV
jgi:hypothetical protein